MSVEAAAATGGGLISGAFNYAVSHAPMFLSIAAMAAFGGVDLHGMAVDAMQSMVVA